ncbi:hypothetical protein Rleg4DRAFT_7759 [Rhizobium leguminosarum bv. trifolii WSM2297]|uniref:Uncharacterized protein n=1 Tax=Rhizobium leguminosarum bv. trifolii WSM2297 TaxID=754762 RepID=J0L729_RHILT|nr:hypothetical protein Rleg4DRAFT_7759 [Rhizobium leguminosarum bv. trifolii WSM2297]
MASKPEMATGGSAFTFYKRAGELDAACQRIISMSGGPISLSHAGIEGYVAGFSGLGMRPYDNFNVLVESC